MAQYKPFSILGGNNAASSLQTYMSLLGSLSFALRVIVEIIRLRHKAASGVSAKCPCCGRTASPASVPQPAAV